MCITSQVGGFLHGHNFLMHICSPETSLAVGKTYSVIGKKHLENTRTMAGQHKTTLCEDFNPTDLMPLYKHSEMESRVEMLRMFNELKETMERMGSETQEK